MQNDLELHRKQILDKETQIQELKASVTMLDNKLDELQNDLDIKTEENHSLKEAIDKQTKEFANV